MTAIACTMMTTITSTTVMITTGDDDDKGDGTMLTVHPRPDGSIATMPPAQSPTFAGLIGGKCLVRFELRTRSKVEMVKSV